MSLSPRQVCIRACVYVCGPPGTAPCCWLLGLFACLRDHVWLMLPQPPSNLTTFLPSPAPCLLSPAPDCPCVPAAAACPACPCLPCLQYGGFVKIRDRLSEPTEDGADRVGTGGDHPLLLLAAAAAWRRLWCQLLPVADAVRHPVNRSYQR
jgi:hypothetical protein